MPFGQPQGPPATARQVAELLGLLQDAGHTGFRDARGPLGLTQRQAGGRFTRDEAEAMIDRLRDEAREKDAESIAELPGDDLRDMPAHALATELHRRGWIVIEP